jgi:hypothetical protein
LKNLTPRRRAPPCHHKSKHVNILQIVSTNSTRIKVVINFCQVANSFLFNALSCFIAAATLSTLALN